MFIYYFDCAGSSLLRIFSSSSKQGLPFTEVCGLVIAVASLAVEHRLNSCGSWAQLFWSVWYLPGPQIEPESPALAGGFLTTEPPGKPPDHS